jgi:hypothetical protein
MVWGESVHPLRAVTVGINTHFSTRRAAVRRVIEQMWSAPAGR